AADLICGLTDGLTIFFAASLVKLLTLSILSFSRYMLINHPLKLKWRLKKRAVKWVALIAWLIGLGLLIPSGLSFRYNPDNGICWREWARGVHPVGYFVATLILGMVVPLVSLTFTYMSTIYTLWFKPSTRRLTRSNSRSGVQTHRKRISVLLGLLIVAYLLCWLPFGIYWLFSAALNHFPDTVDGQIKTSRISKITILVALINNCLDPIVYAFSNRQIKDGAMKTLRGGNANNTVEPTATE
ncbi:MAG: G-protein coupled receptor, partial [Alteromonas sp.]|nr:G-protein coupled receptor [Alteromonas sp.]